MKVKLAISIAISILLALLTATMICSNVRATVTPQPLLLELKETVLEADDWIFEGVIVTNTKQLKNALANKIDATIGLYDITEHDEAADKLRDDISPKLTNPWNDDGTPSKRAQSWLELYPYDSEEWRGMTSFATQCQQIIEEVLMDQPK